MKKQFEIVFSKEIGSIILAILKKYLANDDPKTVFQKIIKKEPLNGEFVRFCVEDIKSGKIKKENLGELLKKQFAVSQEIAEKIAEEVKQNVLPFAEISTEQAPEFKVKTIRPSIQEKKPLQKTNVSDSPDKYRENI